MKRRPATKVTPLMEQQVLHLYVDLGYPSDIVAQRIGIARSCVYSIIHRHKESVRHKWHPTRRQAAKRQVAVIKASLPPSLQDLPVIRPRPLVVKAVVPKAPPTWVQMSLSEARGADPIPEVPRLTPEQMIIVQKAFARGKKPRDIAARHGFHLEAVKNLCAHLEYAQRKG